MNSQYNKSNANLYQIAELLENYGIIWCYDSELNSWTVYDSVDEDGFYKSGSNKYELMADAVYYLSVGKFKK